MSFSSKNDSDRSVGFGTLRFAAAAVVVIGLSGAASAQSAPSRSIGGDPAIDAPLTVENPLPGGGAGPGKIEQGNVKAVAGSPILYKPCASDLNGDGVVDIVDLFQFLDYFDASDERADLVRDKVLGFDDLIAFLVEFDEGC